MTNIYPWLAAAIMVIAVAFTVCAANSRNFTMMLCAALVSIIAIVLIFGLRSY